MADVTYDGPNKLIIANPGITSLNMLDVYSAGKLWMLQSNNAKYLQPMSAIGGDPLPGARYLGTSFFLENDWKMRPFEGSHTLIVTGNVQTRDGSDPFVSTLGNYNVRVMLSVTNLVDTVNIGGGIGTVSEVRDAVWSALGPFPTDSIGERVMNQLLSLVNFFRFKDR